MLRPTTKGGDIEDEKRGNERTEKKQRDKRKQREGGKEKKGKNGHFYHNGEGEKCSEKTEEVL